MACAQNAEGGYDVEFEDESVDTDNISCVICLSILREPVQAVPCGHRFCKNCITKVNERFFSFNNFYLFFLLYSLLCKCKLLYKAMFKYGQFFNSICEKKSDLMYQIFFYHL